MEIKDSEPEKAGWEWLDGKFVNPEDHDYRADEMVAAFMAGMEYVRQSS